MQLRDCNIRTRALPEGYKFSSYRVDGDFLTLTYEKFGDPTCTYRSQVYNSTGFFIIETEDSITWNLKETR